MRTVGCYSVIKVLKHAALWMNLENIMLSEGSLSQKTVCCVIPFI